MITENGSVFPTYFLALSKFAWRKPLKGSMCFSFVNRTWLAKFWRIWKRDHKWEAVRREDHIESDNSEKLPVSLTEGRVSWLTGEQNDGLLDRRIDWQKNRLIDARDRLTGSLTGRLLTSWQTEVMIDWLTDWLTDWLKDWLDDQLIDW